MNFIVLVSKPIFGVFVCVNQKLLVIYILMNSSFQDKTDIVKQKYETAKAHSLGQHCFTAFIIQCALS
jgi:hypothetical protein